MFFGQAMLGDSTLGDASTGVGTNLWDINWNASTPTYNPAPSSSWWDDWGQSVINQGFAIGSQIIGAWGPKPTQQIGAGGMPIGSGYSPAAILQTQAGLQQQIANQNQQMLNAAQNPNYRQTSPNSLDGIFSSLTSTISSNPMIFLGLGVGAYLLFREPPRRR